MSLTITPIYLGLSALLLVLLSFRVIQLRRRFQVGIGDGGHRELSRAIRAHANCAEYLPLLILVIAGVELSGAPGWVVHLFGAATLIARGSHAVGISASAGSSLPRMIGMLLTFSVLFFGGLGLIAHALL